MSADRDNGERRGEVRKTGRVGVGKYSEHGPEAVGAVRGGTDAEPDVARAG